MVVVEQGRNHLNEEVEFIVTNTVQKSAGKMIFGRIDANGAPAAASDPQTPQAAHHPKRGRHRPEPAPSETTER